MVAKSFGRPPLWSFAYEDAPLSAQQKRGVFWAAGAWLEWGLVRTGQSRLEDNPRTVFQWSSPSPATGEARLCVYFRLFPPTAPGRRDGVTVNAIDKGYEILPSRRHGRA